MIQVGTTVYTEVAEITESGELVNVFMGTVTHIYNNTVVTISNGKEQVITVMNQCYTHHDQCEAVKS